MSLLLIDKRDSVAVLTINDDERRNIISPDLVDEIIEAVTGIEADEAMNALIITGAGQAFCAGADLGDLSAARDGYSSRIEKVYEGFMTIARCKLPTIAAVNGPAVGAGMNLAAACDIRVAARSAVFDTRFMQLGLHPGGGHTWMLQRAMGWQGAVATLLLGEKLSGEQAVQRGLAWICVDDERLLDAARQLAARVDRFPRDLLIQTKQSLVDTAAMTDHEEAVSYEYEKQMHSVQQPAFADLIEAMQQKVSKKSGEAK
ncbi:MAG: enoyl-CoA hydratase [Pseudomonadales bacterium]|nr:enoyl-CoA hydratase [Pseudomonadales bacterium]